MAAQTATSSNSAAPSKTPKSPPLAFQPTSNDTLVAPSSLSHAMGMFHSPDALPFPSMRHKIEPFGRSAEIERELQAHVDKLSEALRLQHRAFAAERECWESERLRLFRRVTSLETLLKNINGHSPSRSPVVSPFSGNTYTPPHPRGSSNNSSRLASIAENDHTSAPGVDRRILNLQRDAAPCHIDIPSISYTDGQTEAEQELIDNASDIDAPPSPPATRIALSPPPSANRRLAGHTPMRAPDRLPVDIIPSPRSTSDRRDDSPTRINTERNTLHEKDDSLSESDSPLKGPLHMPELPNMPGAENFTLESLSARLQDIVEHPEDNEPIVLRTSSPDVFVPGPGGTIDAAIHPLQKVSSMDSHSHDTVERGSRLSPPPASESSESAALPDFDAGIRLKTKASVNFGAPFGQLGPSAFRKH